MRELRGSKKLILDIPVLNDVNFSGTLSFIPYNWIHSGSKIFLDFIKINKIAQNRLISSSLQKIDVSICYINAYQDIALNIENNSIVIFFYRIWDEIHWKVFILIIVLKKMFSKIFFYSLHLHSTSFLIVKYML